nr:hypothetical protein [bacterium]
MKRTLHWLFLGLVVAGAAGGAAALARLLLRPPGQPTEAERRAMIERVLDRDAGNIFCFDPDISYRLKPSFRGRRHDSRTLPHQTDSYGMLGDREPETGADHILLLGDSVVYGEYLPREDSFAARLEKEAPAGLQVLTGACPGWSTHQEIGYWEKYLAGISWRRAFIFFCLNDLLRFEWVWGGEDRFRISEEVAGLGGLLAAHCRSLKLRFLRGAFSDNPGLRPLAGLNNTCLVPFLKEWWDAYGEAVGPRLRGMNAAAPVTVVGLPAREQLAALNAG